MENNKSIASRWSSITQPVTQEVKQPAVENNSVVSPADKSNPVRHQYRQTILNGLKGENNG